jgi:hypothetical protein
MGGSTFTLTVYGANFVANSVVRWSGADRPTTFMSATQLQAEIPASDISLAGTALVTVFNPPPGGGMSGPLAFSTAVGTTCPCSLWSDATIPAVTADPDPAAVEVGMKFRASSHGFVTGVRFYKGVGNTGPHTGHLWTANGMLLAAASFTHAAATGWQQANFPTPMAIEANTTYVVSYYAPVGHYANNVGYFTGAGVTKGPLRALASAEEGGNGVFSYGVSSFPTQTFNAINYWVDPVFMPDLPLGTLVDATVADFSAGSMDTTTYIGQSTKGEVMLAPTVGVEFAGNTLPVGWTTTSWNKGGWARVTDGRLTVRGARVGTVALFGPGRALEFMATFSGAANQHAGFGLMLNEPPWAMFSTHSGGSLWARTRLGSTSQDTPLAANWLGTPHRFHIIWNETSVVYMIDGLVVATHLLGLTPSMRPVISDPTVGQGIVVVDWLRLTPYATAGTFLSRVLDAGAMVSWENLTWTSTVPVGTNLGLSVRQGNTPTPDGSWTAFVPLAWSGMPIGGRARYVQYRAILTSTIPLQTPTLHSVTITYGPKR